MVKIPTSLKTTFKKGIKNYIKEMGREITVILPPVEADCPNCIWDAVSNKSTNVYNQAFIRPVNIFPGKSYQTLVYPKPFNISDSDVDPGIQYDPTLPNPAPLKSSVCPVCKGKGVITKDNNICIKAHITWNPKEEYLDLSAGRDGVPMCRIKTYKDHYSLCTEAKSFLIDGVKCVMETPPKVKGLGDVHLIEFYLVQTQVDDKVTIKYDEDPRVNKDLVGQISDQASVGTPTVPPSIPSDDGAW